MLFATKKYLDTVDIAVVGNNGGVQTWCLGLLCFFVVVLIVVAFFVFHFVLLDCMHVREAHKNEFVVAGFIRLSSSNQVARQRKGATLVTELVVHNVEAEAGSGYKCIAI